MSALERMGTVLMNGKSAKLAVRSSDNLVLICAENSFSVEMTVTEARAWREGLSRAIRQAEAAEVAK